MNGNWENSPSVQAYHGLRAAIYEQARETEVANIVAGLVGPIGAHRRHCQRLAVVDQLSAADQWLADQFQRRAEAQPA